MKKDKNAVRYMATLAMFCGILLVMGMTGIGFIPLPVIKATTMHIPVILGAILLGPKAGAVLGCVFGLCSAWSNTISPTLLSFAFSPVVAMQNGGFVGLLKSLWIAIGCRTLLGVAAGWLWRLLKTWKLPDLAALSVTAAIATITHTVLVMGSIYLMLAQQYAEAKNVAMSAVFGLIMGTVTASGIPEAIAAVVVVAASGKILLRILARSMEGQGKKNASCN